MTVPSPLGPELKVLVLAGSNPMPAGAQRGAREVPLTNKAFLRLRDRFVVEYVLDLLRECGLSHIWLLAPEDQIARVPARHRFIPVIQQPDASFVANLLSGSAAMAPRADEPVLVAFGDHPLHSPNALQVFLHECAARLDEADFFHAMALQGSYREYAAWFRRTSFHTREMSGRASGLSVVVPSRLHALAAFDRFYGVRKLERVDSFLTLLSYLARSLGAQAPRILLDAVLLYLAKDMEKLGHRAWTAAPAARWIESWLAHRVPVRRLERCAARVLGAERGVRLIPIAHGGIAIDVDYIEELTALESHWDEVQGISARQDAALRISPMASSKATR